MARSRKMLMSNEVGVSWTCRNLRHVHENFYSTYERTMLLSFIRR